MYERKIPIDLDCPLRLTMSLIDSKWKSCILDELRYKPMRPSELHKASGGRWPSRKNDFPGTATPIRIFHYPLRDDTYPNYRRHA